MDEREMEQKFDAMYMAIVNNKISAARSVFQYSIQIVVDKKLDQIVELLKEEGKSCCIQEIKEFRCKQRDKIGC